MLNSMDKFASQVLQRTQELDKVTAAMTELLNQLFPPTVAEMLSNGETVEPEFYESVTIAFTYVV